MTGRGSLRELVARGLPAALTITTDGTPGPLRAVEEQWPQSLRLSSSPFAMRPCSRRRAGGKRIAITRLERAQLQVLYQSRGLTPALPLREVA
jgi:hypothetical protein